VAHPEEEIHNPRTGQRMRFRQTGEDTDGALLQIESVNPPTGVAEPEHVHPNQESRAEVMSGTLRFVVDGRPALRTADFFKTLFDLAQQGKLDERGMPSLLTLALLGPGFANEIRATSPPWPVQRAAFALLAPIARLRGYATV